MNFFAGLRLRESGSTAVKIPVYQPHFSGKERDYVLDCLESGWISWHGSYLDKFANGCGNFIGARHVNCVSNGTAALHLALVALGIGPGDEVIVPTLTYVASANAIKYVGASPIFCDSDRKTWQLDLQDMESRITARTKAIMAVHLYGQPAPMVELMAIAKTHRLAVIEDAAEGLGSRIGDRHVGTYGDISTFSFFSNKVITTGEGGLVVTQREDLHREVSLLKGQYASPSKRYWHDKVGYNYRMTNVQAAIGFGQLADLEWVLRAKRNIAAAYRWKLAGLPVTCHEEVPGTTHNFWMCSILVENPQTRDALRRHLERWGVETRPLFYPAHTLPMFAADARGQSFATAEDISGRGINLPSYPDLTEKELEYICLAIYEFFSLNSDAASGGKAERRKAAVAASCGPLKD
jgi:perosamine synthetase